MEIPRVRRALLDWYRTAARDLPWRRTRDPYAIWVSEVMLQQTRVETVLPYYGRFLARFPTLATLARAREGTVLSLWSGLGYYRRARLLHAGAKAVLRDHGGEVPRDPEARRALPGVGRYTAGALGSIAFGLPEPIVDGNVARVLTRLEGIDTPLGEPRTEAALWALAEGLVRGPRPGDMNQALMELGATVCTPRAPACHACPVRRACVAAATDRAGALPVPRKRKPPARQAWALVVPTLADGRVVLTKGDAALFGGLWNFPHARGRGQKAALRALAAAGFDGDVEARPAGRFRHVLTHRDLDVVVWAADVRARPKGARGANAAGLATLGVSALTRRAFALAVGSATE